MRRIIKKRPKPSPATYEGSRRLLDGHLAAYGVEVAASEMILVEDVGDFTELIGPMRGLLGNASSHAGNLVRAMSNVRSMSAVLTGAAETGLRSATFVQDSDGLRASLSAMAGRRLPVVIHLTARARNRQASAVRGGHDGYYDLGRSGAFQLFASSPQEVADLTLIAHRLAEISLTPGVCAQDLYSTTHGMRPLNFPEPELISVYLGAPGDSIPAPTRAQALLFGSQRRRVPEWIDPDNPIGVGGVQDEDSYFKSVAAQRAFFNHDLPDLTRQAMDQYGELTGRWYSPLHTYRMADADVVVVAQGSIVEELRNAVDYVRDTDKLKAGLIGVTMYRPFPGPQLTTLLQGKKAVTALDRTDDHLTSDPPLSQEIRAALSHAIENGAAQRGSEPHSGYASYRGDDSPSTITGVYGIGSELPGFEDLVSVLRNMAAGGATRRRFYCGLGTDDDADRFPHLHALKNQLHRAYPNLDGTSLAPVGEVRSRSAAVRSIGICGLATQGGIFAGNIFAQVLEDTFGWDVRTYPRGGLERSLQPSQFTLAWSPTGTDTPVRPSTVQTLLISGETQLEQLPTQRTLHSGGVIVVESTQAPEVVWHRLTTRTQRWIGERQAQLFVMNSQQLTAETTSHPAFVDQLLVWALLGAAMALDEPEFGAGKENVLGALRARLHDLLGEGNTLVADILTCVSKGADALQELDREAMQINPVPDVEHEAPWPVRAQPESTDTLFDVSRFWRSVGYLHETGRTADTLVDPYVASGAIPARSSAFRDLTPYRLRTPTWLPENCTGCGTCWAVCPESALPTALQSIPELIDTALESIPEPLTQLKRVVEPLAKLTYKTAKADGLAQHLSLSSLLQTGFDQLVEKLGLEDAQRTDLEAEFASLRASTEGIPVARTDQLFIEADRRQKGEGRLLSIAVNPMSCTGCGICVASCPDGAFDWATTRDSAELERHWHFVLKTPVPSSEVIDRFVSPTDPTTHVNRLLDRRVYHTMVGGDGAPLGDGAKTAVHLTTAAIESVYKPRIESHLERLSQLIEKIRAKIQGSVAGTIEINDFAAFAQRLSRVDADELTPEALARLVSDERASRTVDPKRLQYLNDILVRLENLLRRYETSANGGGRSCVVLAVDPDAVSFWTGTYPYNPHAHPWISHLAGDAPALAEGLFAGLARHFAEEVALYRTAEREAREGRSGASNDSAIRWTDFTDDEWGLMPTVLIVARTGITDWSSIDRLCRSGIPVKVLFVENQPVYAPSRDDGDGSDNPLLTRIGGPGDVFLAQSSIGHPGHLISSVAQGTGLRGPAIFYVYAPDPHTSSVSPDQIIEQARLAVDSRAFPLFVADSSGIATDGNPDPARDWAQNDLRVREPSGMESHRLVSVTPADWAAKEGRFRPYFRIVARGEVGEHTMHVSDYVRLSSGEREAYEPYIDVTDERDRHFVAILGAPMVELVENCYRGWQRLRSRASEFSVEATAASEVAEPAPVTPETPAPSGERNVYEALAERLLVLSGYGQDETFFKLKLRDFRERHEDGDPDA